MNILDQLYAEDSPLVADQFYPRFTDGARVSCTPWGIIKEKGRCRLNLAFKPLDAPRGLYHDGTDTIDSDIQRLGAPKPATGDLKTIPAIVQAMAAALRSDFELWQDRFPGVRHYLSTGGKDSQIMLLFPWRVKPLVISSHPNHPWNVMFIQKNKLGFEIADRGSGGLVEATPRLLANCCQTDLQLFRPTRLPPRAILWVGATADVWLTPGWKKLEANGEAATPTRFWRRYFGSGCLWQGFIHGLYAECFNILLVSAYHGPAVSRVRDQIDLHAIQTDIRPLIANELFRRPVWFPDNNPSPACAVRQGNEGCQVATWSQLAGETGVIVAEGQERRAAVPAPVVSPPQPIQAHRRFYRRAWDWLRGRNG